MAVPEHRSSVVSIRLVQSDGRTVDYLVHDGDVETAALEAVRAWREGDELRIGGPGWSRRVFPPPPATSAPRLRLVTDSEEVR